MPDILFVQNYYFQTLGIMQTSAVLKEHGLSTDVVIGDKQTVVKTVLEKKPRVLGFYCTTGFHHKSLDIARQVKAQLGSGILTILGGPHPTHVPEVVESEGVDAICRGEGEYALLELLQALKEDRTYSDIANLWVKSNGSVEKNDVRPLCDLDDLTSPDRELYVNYPYIYRHKQQEIMLGRGCPFSCTFCSVHAFREMYRGKGAYMRFRSIDNVIAELKDLKERFSPSCFFFHDDTFVLKNDYCRDFLAVYTREVGVPFAGLVRADLITDELAATLKSAGCYRLYFGIESGNDHIRNNVLKKKLTKQQILECADILHQHKIPFSTFNMMGLPDGNLEEAWETVELNVQARPAWAFFTVYQTLPNTELAQYAVDKGYIHSIDVAESDSTFHEGSIMLRNHPDGDKILRLKNVANLMIKLPFLRPVVKGVLLRLPVNGLYGMLDKLLYFVFYYSKLTYKQGVFRTLYSGIYLARRLKEFK